VLALVVAAFAVLREVGGPGRSGAVDAPGETRKVVPVYVCSDGIPEPTERFSSRLSDPVRAVLRDGGTGYGRIRDGVGGAVKPCSTGVWAADASAAEPVNVQVGDTPPQGPLNFTVRLNQPAPGRVAVNYSTFDRTATAGEDYHTKSGQVPDGQFTHEPDAHAQSER